MDAIAGRVCAESITGKQELIEHYGVKGSVAEKSFRVNQRMGTEKILKRGYEKPCVMDGFIFIGRVRFFLNDDFGMVLEKVLIVKSKMTENTKAIGNNTDFVSIAKVAINVKLLNIRIGSGMGRHGGISSFIRVKMIIKVMSFRISFELFDDSVGVFGIIFSDPGFDTGRIKNGHICFRRIDGVADGFGKINKLIKNKLEVIKEILLKASNFRSIRNFVKTAEITKMSGIVEEYQKQGIGRDRKNALDDEGPQKGMQRVFTGSAR